MLQKRATLICATIASCLCLLGCKKGTSYPTTVNNPQGNLITQSCSGCHQATNEVIPSISTLSTNMLKASLLRYKNDDGQTVMHRLMRGYSDAEITKIAEALGASDE